MKRILILFLLILPVATLTSQAKVRLGVRAGAAMGKLNFNRIVDSKYRTGFTVGGVVDLNMPLGFGLDAGVMFTHRSDNLSVDVTTHEDINGNYKRDFFEFPVHLDYSLSIVGLSSVVKPYVFAGPVFSLLSHESKKVRWDNCSFNTSIDLGFGVELVSHLQISAAYRIGLNHSIRSWRDITDDSTYSAHDRCWLVTAAFMF